MIVILFMNNLSTPVPSLITMYICLDVSLLWILERERKKCVFDIMPEQE